MTQYGTLGTLKIKLAEWVPRNERYRRQYSPLNAESESVSSRETGLVVDTKFRPWVVRDWARGEGFEVWTREIPGYRIATGVRPHPTEEGLILAQDGTLMLNSAGGTFATAFSIFGIGADSLWVGDEDNVYKWQGTGNFSAAVSSGAPAGSQFVWSWAQSSDAGFMFAVLTDPDIYKFQINDVSQTLHYNGSAAVAFNTIPHIVSFQNRVFILEQGLPGILSELDQMVAQTRTTVAETGMLAVNLNDRALVASDKGPIWWARDGQGDTYIWEYNVAEDTQAILGRIPASFVAPFSIYFAKGFVFVAYRAAPVWNLAGEVYIYFKRGGQEGVIGPLRDANDTIKPFLAGVLGSELIIGHDQTLWAYDLDTGGIVEFGQTAGVIKDAVVFGNNVMVWTGNNVERFTPGTKYLASGTIHLGWHDFDYPGLRKQFLDVTVITDPLPAGTSVTAAVSVDGSATYTALTGTHDVDGATKFTFTVANPTSASINGNRFEVRLTLATSNTANTPTIKEVSARATGADHVLEVILQVDVGDIDEQTSSTLVDGLNAMAVASAPQTFTDVWQQRLEGGEVPDSYVVTVEEVVTPAIEDPADDEDHPVALVRLRSMSLV